MGAARVCAARVCVCEYMSVYACADGCDTVKLKK